MSTLSFGLIVFQPNLPGAACFVVLLAAVSYFTIFWGKTNDLRSQIMLEKEMMF